MFANTRPRVYALGLGLGCTRDTYNIYQKEANSKKRKARQADIPRYKCSRLISQDIYIPGGYPKI